MKRLMFFAVLLVAVQGQEKFKVRLTTVPLDNSMRATVTGKGSATATLTGNKLAITGSFEGLASAATLASVHQGKVTGVRGPAIGELAVTKAQAGTITGSINLTPDEVDSLTKGRLYIQIHSEKAPEGNLWGWLLR